MKGDLIISTPPISRIVRSGFAIPAWKVAAKLFAFCTSLAFVGLIWCYWDNQPALIRGIVAWWLAGSFTMIAGLWVGAFVICVLSREYYTFNVKGLDAGEGIHAWRTIGEMEFSEDRLLLTIHGAPGRKWEIRVGSVAAGRALLQKLDSLRSGNQ